MIQQFFHMGGYAAYVWSAYGIAAVMLTTNIVYSHYKRRQIQHDLYKLYRPAERV